MINTDSKDTEIIVRVPATHACYADHFPGAPLVPGALLLKWIMAAIEEKLQCQLSQIKQIKFLAAVKPADELRVLVAVNPVNATYSVNVWVGETGVIKGVFQATANTLAESNND